MRHLHRALLPAFLLLLHRPCVPAQQQPDYSGTWQQVNERCVPRPKNKQAFYRMVVEQSSTSLHLRITTNKGKLALDYEMNGKELVYTGLDGDQFHTKVHRDGQSLVFETIEHERGHKLPAKEVWTLADQDHTLQRVKEAGESGKQSTATYILEKQ
jgi:hypothetical protein